MSSLGSKQQYKNGLPLYDLTKFLKPDLFGLGASNQLLPSKDSHLLIEGAKQTDRRKELRSMQLTMNNGDKEKVRNS
jgi:hypothetical protein